MEKHQNNSNQMQSQTKQNQPMQQEEQLMDFSAMFKKNAVVSKPKLGKYVSKTQGPNWLLQIPAKIQITKQDLYQRKVLNMKRWMTMVKGDKKQQLLSSVISIWNYLYSTVGIGKQNMLTLQAFKQFSNVYELNYQANTNQEKIKLSIQIFNLICKQFNIVSLKHEIISLTQGCQSEAQLNSFLKGLKQNTVYIYFAYRKILCPIGYQITPLVPLDAYKKLGDIQKKNQELWIIMSQCGTQQRSFMIKRWKDIQLQLKSQWPQYLDLEQTKKGRQTYSQQNQMNKMSKRQKSFILSFSY